MFQVNDLVSRIGSIHLEDLDPLSIGVSPSIERFYVLSIIVCIFIDVIHDRFLPLVILDRSEVSWCDIPGRR